MSGRFWSGVKAFLGIRELPEKGRVVQVENGYYMVQLTERLFCRVGKTEAGAGYRVGDIIACRTREKPESRVILTLARIMVTWFFISMFFMLLYSWYYK